MNIFALPALMAIDPQPSDIVVTLTGVALVFLILILLMIVIMIEGKIFTSRQEKPEPTVKPVEPVKTPEPIVVKEPEPIVEEGIPEAVVAAITAAIACMGDGKYKLRSVERAGKARKNAWSKAGVSDVTSPF